MKRKIISLLLALLLIIEAFPMAALAADGVTVITTADELEALGGNSISNASYQLGADIDMTGKTMRPITRVEYGEFDGNGHTISNLTVESTSSYSDAGLFAQTGREGVIKNLTLKDCSVTGIATSSSYGTGMLVGKVSGMESRIQNCAVVGGTVSAPTGSYNSVNAGGMIGYIDNDCVVENSFSTAAVTGSTYSNAAVGGLVGNINDTAAMKNCYARASVSGTGGGLAGKFSGGGSSTPSTITNCYSASTFTGSGTQYGFGKVGYYCNFDTCYYDSTLAGSAAANAESGITALDTALLKTTAAAVSGFQADLAEPINEGYPILKWQDPNALYTFTLTVEPKDAKVTWDGVEQAASSDGVYVFSGLTSGGSHTYKVEQKDDTNDYIPQEETVTIGKSDSSKTVALAANTYALTFTLEPEDAVLTVTDGEGSALTPNGDGSFTVANGTYPYTVEKFGYVSASGSVTVNKADASESVTLSAAPADTVTFQYGPLPQGGGAVEGASLTVVTGDREIQPTGEMTYSLPVGNSYTYTFKSRNYAKVTGTIDLTGVSESKSETVTIPLTVKTAWGGPDDIIPPTQGDGTENNPYEISTGGELAWLAQETNKTSTSRTALHAVLTKDIDLGGEPWTPIGLVYGTRYSSVFNGAGHTVSGLSIAASSAGNYGLFGYVENGTVKDLTVAGTINITGSGYSYGSCGIGGVVGQLSGMTGTIENCVNRVNVTGPQNVAGIAGYITSGYNTAEKRIASCVNRGSIVSTGNKAGGIAAYVYGQVAIENCYNTGSITGGGWYSGGIAASVSSSYATVERCYTVGEVADGNGAYPALGQVSGAAVSNLFFLDTLGTDGNAAGISESELKAVPEALAGIFWPDSANSNNGWPILDFQVQKFPVSITVSPQEAKVTVSGAIGTQENGLWTCDMPAGTYEYEVSCFGYIGQSGQLTVTDGAVNETVTLAEASKKTVAFDIRFSDNNPAGAAAALTLTWNGETVQPSSGSTYDLPYGEYHYVVKAKGYAKAEADLTVDGSSAGSVSITLEATTAWDGESYDEPAVENGVYQIGTGNELAWLGKHVNEGNGASANAVLTADVDLAGYPWTPMGNSYSIKYKSTFDGQGHTVSGLSVNGAEYAGLFGQAESAAIQNLVVQGEVNGTGRTAGVVGYAYADCRIENCGSEAAVTGSGSWTGGIVGYIGSSYDKGSSITGCYNAGAVTATGSAYNYAGGILGYDYAGAEVTLSDCYNTGTVTGSGYAGGIRAYGSSMIGAIQNCYNAGTVAGADASKTGALAPGTGSTITNSYYLDGGTDGNTSSVAKTAAEMQQPDFLALLNGEGGLWKQDANTNSGYPILSWQKVNTPPAPPEEGYVLAEAEFVWVDYTDPETEEPAGWITPYLQWKPVDGAESYTLTLWNQSFVPEDAGTAADPDNPGYVVSEKKVWSMADVAGSSVSGLPQDQGLNLETGWLYYDLQEVFETLGDGRYHITVTPAGEAVPTLEYVQENIFGYDTPYNRLAPVTGLHWDGTRAAWTPKTGFTAEDAYGVILYKLDAEGNVMSSTFQSIPGNYSKVDCSGSFVIGGRYAFSVTALAESELMPSLDYTDSLESRLSSDPKEAGAAGVYVVAETEIPGGEHGEDWTAISTAEQWIDLANVEDVCDTPNDPESNRQKIAWGKKYYLTGDLDFSNLSTEYAGKTKSIGNVTNRFLGVLDGNGHKITGLTLSNYDSGLFWYIGSTGCVYNLTIEGANILVSDNAAVLAHNNYGLIEKCAVINSNITADTGAVIGGMASRNFGIIRDSFVQGGELRSNSTTATGHAGFVGSVNGGGLIERCWTSMDVNTQSDYAGGFVGLCYGETGSPSIIRDCFALGDVAARGYSGGFVGRSVYENCIYENCYAAGNISGTGESIHGFIGGNKPDSGFGYDQSYGVLNCYYNSANPADPSCSQGAKALSEMKTDSFKALLNAGDEEVWLREDGKNSGLPYLKAVKVPEEPDSTEITVTVTIAVYDKETYAFSQMGGTISVTIASTGNTRVVDVLDAAQEQGKLTYSYDTTPTFGRYIHTINGHAVESPDGWMFTVNDALSNVSASLATVKDGDGILWYEGTTENRFLPPTREELAGSQLQWVDISTVEELLSLTESGADLSKNYRLTADLDLTGKAFPGIGSADHPFTGVFDGQGHTVSNVSISGTVNTGFFNVLRGGTVKNLHLREVDVTGSGNVGALVGFSQAVLNKADTGDNIASLVGNCTVSGGTVSGTQNVGGLIGLNGCDADHDAGLSTSSSVDKCTADVTVSGSSEKIGGLLGCNQGIVTKSGAKGNVAAENSVMVGGFAGDNTGSIYNSFAEGDVTGKNVAGGFAGSSGGSVKDSYSLGSVTAESNTGSFAGTLYAADTVIGAGVVTAKNGQAGGLAGTLTGQITGIGNQITVKNAYGNCSGSLHAIGNISQYQGDGNAAALDAMKLDAADKVSDKLYELFKVNIKAPAELTAELDKYADSLFVPNATPAGTVLELLKSGESASDGITASYAVSGGLLTGGNSLTLTKANEGAALEIPVTLTLRDGAGNTVQKEIRLYLQGKTSAPNDVMDAIAQGYRDSSDSWTVLDMALYSALDGKTFATSKTARQNALNLLITQAASPKAAVSDRARIELVLRAMGIDSTKLFQKDKTPVNNAEALAAMDLIGGGYYAVPWILLAAQQGNFQLTQAQESELISLLKSNMGNGLFGYEYNGVTYSDPDTACIALAALAGSDSADAREIKSKVLGALPGILDETGSLGNANSDAMAVIGLIAVGQDPADWKSASGASLVDGLMSHVNKNGNGFLFAGQENALATEQGFRALIALSMFKGAPLNIYDFSGVSVQPGQASGSGTSTGPSGPVGTTDITVTFTLKTNTATWIPKTTLTLAEGSTVYHAFTKALADAGMSAEGAESGYVRSITNGDVTLSEFDKGPKSGWLYKVNGISPQVGLTSYALNDGDDILWYYSTDGTSDTGTGEPAGFTDISGHWAEDAINRAVGMGLFSGTSATTFSPNVTLNRAMMAQILFNLQKPDAVYETSFEDLEAGRWYVKAVAWAGANGIVKGVGKNRFAPLRSVTRQEMAVMIYNYAAFLGLDTSTSGSLDAFADGEKTARWARDAMCWATEKGIFSGKGSGVLDPTGNATRAESVTVILKFMELTAE